MPQVVVSRRVHFNAAHRLWNPRWSESHTIAGITMMSSSVRTTGRQNPTHPPEIGTMRMPRRRWPTLPPIVGMKSTCMSAKIASVNHECSTEL